MQAYYQAIQDSVRIPAVLQNVASTANSDLYSGPIYIDSDGDHVSCFDKYDHQFDFSRGVAIVSEWLNNLPTLFYLEWVPSAEPASVECEIDGDLYPEIPVDDIAVALFGRELASYL
jgi:hypothetical protein